MNLVEVELARVVIQTRDDPQYLHLREKKSGRSFPIVIGANEVEEINRKLHKLQPERPLTHDLCGRLIQKLGFQLERVAITELKNNTFYATLSLKSRDLEQQVEVDCRPSDAIALAVQTGCRIFVASDVLDIVASE